MPEVMLGISSDDLGAMVVAELQARIAEGQSGFVFSKWLRAFVLNVIEPGVRAAEAGVNGFAVYLALLVAIGSAEVVFLARAADRGGAVGEPVGVADARAGGADLWTLREVRDPSSSLKKVIVCCNSLACAPSSSAVAASSSEADAFCCVV